jgi:hypothetical protein
MKFDCSGLNQGGKLNANMAKAAAQVKQAAQGAAQDAANRIVQRGRADIAGAGNFGGNWTSALQATVVEKKNQLDVTVTMTGGPPVSYWRVFEYGATISAKNPSGLMWIPTDKSNKTWPRDYPGSLFRIGRGLFDSKTRQPMYFGTPQVIEPQKFHLRDIVKQVAKEMGQLYTLHMR